MLMRLFIQLLFLLVFSSCQVMCQTNMQNVPLFKEQGEASITINPSNIQVANAVTDQGGIMCNVFFQTTSWTDQQTTLSNNFYKTLRYNFETGAGYFIPHGEDGVIEIYAGGGYGE